MLKQLCQGLLKILNIELDLLPICPAACPSPTFLPS